MAAIKIGHAVDVPCYIDENVVEKSNEFTFERALMERNLGMVQILAPMVDNPNPHLFPTFPGRLFLMQLKMLQERDIIQIW